LVGNYNSQTQKKNCVFNFEFFIAYSALMAFSWHCGYLFGKRGCVVNSLQPKAQSQKLCKYLRPIPSKFSRPLVDSEKKTSASTVVAI